LPERKRRAPERPVFAQRLRLWERETAPLRELPGLWLRPQRPAPERLVLLSAPDSPGWPGQAPDSPLS
jgi:hypothetical protein